MDVEHGHESRFISKAVGEKRMAELMRTMDQTLRTTEKREGKYLSLWNELNMEQLSSKHLYEENNNG